VTCKDEYFYEVI